MPAPAINVIATMIRDYGYVSCTKTTFLEQAPSALVARADDLAVQRGGYSWVIWDPNDDADGFLLVGDSPGALCLQWFLHFEGWL